MVEVQVNMEELRAKVLDCIKGQTMMLSTNDIARNVGGSFCDICQALNELVKEKVILKGPTGRFSINKRWSPKATDVGWKPTCTPESKESGSKIKQSFKCKHCGRPFAYLKACRKHEESCSKQSGIDTVQEDDPLPGENVSDLALLELREVESSMKPTQAEVQGMSSELTKVKSLLDLCRPPSDFSGVTMRIGPFLVTVEQIRGA